MKIRVATLFCTAKVWIQKNRSYSIAYFEVTLINSLYNFYLIKKISTYLLV